MRLGVGVRGGAARGGRSVGVKPGHNFCILSASDWEWKCVSEEPVHCRSDHLYGEIGGWDAQQG